MRPISLAVDVTNYVMLDLGQPLHAYDLAQLAAPIVVRRATPGERLRTLDGVERALDPEDLLITDSPDGCARLARPRPRGVMGGADSEVERARPPTCSSRPRTSTRSRSRAPRAGTSCPARRPSASSAASTPQLPPVAVARAVALLVEHGGGRRRARLTDVDRRGAAPPFDLAAGPAGAARRRRRTRPTRCARRSVAIGCDGRRRRRRAPSRVQAADLAARPASRAVDLVEEVARLRGYDAIPSVAARRARRARASPPASGPAARSPGRWPSAGWSRCSATRSSAPTQHDALGLPADDDRAPCGPPGQPAVRRAAVAAHEPAGHAARHRPAQRQPRRERRGGLRDRPGHAPGRRRARGAAAARRRAALGRATWRRSTPPCRRSRAGSPGCSRACASPPAGGGRVVGPTTPTRSRPPALVAEVRRGGADASGRRRPRAVAPGPVRAPHARPTARSSGTPASCTRTSSPRWACRPARSRSSSTSTCCSRRRRPTRCRRRPVSTFPVAKEDIALVVDAVRAGRRRARRGPGRRGVEPGRRRRRGGPAVRRVHRGPGGRGPHGRSRSRCGCGPTTAR